MLNAVIVERPRNDQFARVDLVKATEGQEVLDGDDKWWILGQPLVVEVDDGETVTVPVGFTTDGASIPERVQKWTKWKAFEGPQRWAGIVHDWLYHQRGYDKGRADAIFRAILKSEGADRIRMTSMYWAVKLFGRNAFERNQRRDVSKRIWGNPASPDDG